MPTLIVAAVASYLGVSAIVQVAIAVAVTVYGSITSRDSARRARNQARDAYNASLQDRTATLMSTEAPWQIVYGQAVVGGTPVALLTSGDKDQFKHVVIVWAAHECEAITDFRVNGVSVGSLDSDGNVLGGKYNVSETDTVTVVRTVSGTGSFSIAGTGGLRVLNLTDNTQPIYFLAGSECTIAGGTVELSAGSVSFWAGRTVRVTLDTSATSSRLRVRHHLGSPDQTADTLTISECPGDWSATDRLRGLCYSIVRLDLNEPEFQGGLPEFTVKVKGRKLYDHRTGTTAWTDNNALCTADFLTAEYGKRALSTQLDQTSVDVTANACDEALTKQPGERRFTCNGSFRTDQNPDQTLAELCQSMAGFATYTGSWHLQAGVYTAPVMDLGDADNAGSVQGVADESELEIFNGLRGQFFDPDRVDQRTDYTPYQNTALVTEDGGEIWGPLNLPFTNRGWRCHNLARIQVERSRGMQLVVPCKRRLLGLRVGARVTYTNSYLKITRGIFRVVKWEYQLGQPVVITIAQDDPSYYDEVDAPGSLPSPASPGVDPFRVDPVSGLSASSGTAALLLQTDGTVLSRVHVTCTPSTDTLVTKGGALQIEFRRDSDTTWQRAPEASGAGGDAYLLGLQELQVYVIRARWRNSVGVTGDWRSTSVLHVGKSQAPAAVSGFSLSVVPGALRGSRTPSIEADYSRTIYVYGSSFAGGTLVPGTSDRNGFTWPWPPMGAVTIWAADVDDSGNIGPAVSASITVDNRLLVASSGISPSPGWLNSNVGGVNLLWGSQNGPLTVGPGNYGVQFAALKGPGGNPFGLQPGEVLSLSADVWQDATSAAAGQNATVYLYTQRADNTWTSSAALTAVGQTQVGARVTTSFTLPSSASDMVLVAVGLWHQGGSTNTVGTVYADRIQVERGPTATQYKPGAQPGATVGAQLGTNLVDSGGAVLVDSAVKNSAITMNADGTISGAGGGGATLQGMGLTTFRVVAVGASATSQPSNPGLWKDGSSQFGYTRSYLMARVRRSDGMVTFTGSYDVYGNASQAAALAADLNATGSDSVVVVYTWDEPQANRLTNGLDAAMYRCGASRAVFGSPQFQYRSAYVLIGIAGCGEGNGAEAYQGSVGADTNAWVDVGFSLRSGTIVGVNAAYTPRTLQDYNYTGDLNATSDLVLVNDGGMVISGNSVTKSSGSDGSWDAAVHSKDSFTGGAFVSWVVDSIAHAHGLGLNTDPTTNASYTSIDAWLYVEGGTRNLYVFNNGTNIAAISSCSPGDVLAVTYDGSYFRYLKNGAVLYAQAATVTAPLFLDSAFANIGGSAKNIRFGPLTSNAWASIGGSGKPQDNATVGAPAGTYVAGQLAQDLVTTASNAASTASGAATDASSALNKLSIIRSNGYLDASEKPAVIKAWQAIYNENGGIYSAGTTYGLTTLRDAYASAYNSLASYLSGLSPSWNDTSTDTPITPATDQATWAAYYSARQTLLNAIADAAAQRAVWANVTGSGRPADNATVGATFGVNISGQAGTSDIATTAIVELASFTFGFSHSNIA